MRPAKIQLYTTYRSSIIKARAMIAYKIKCDKLGIVAGLSSKLART